MKKIGEYITRGQFHPDGGFNFDNPIKIQLFDGSFGTGYRISKFYVWGIGIDAGQDNDTLGLLATEEIDGTVLFDASDNRQIAWATNKGHTFGDVDPLGGGIVDPENLIVEDLFLYGFTGDQSTTPMNYLIVMEKYDISEWQGALQLVRNSSQG